MRFRLFLFGLLLIQAFAVDAQNELKGWAANAVNTVVFRNNSIVSYGDTQFIAYYDAEGFVCLGKRSLDSLQWEIKRTDYKGNMHDAHNCISIMVDGDGYLHVSWNHHNTPLNYAKSLSPLSLALGEKQAMTGNRERKVTYPAFYKTADGNLFFIYRDGSSGNGNLVLNSYDLQTKDWEQLHDNLIDGEGLRNAYWQACTDKNGVIHLSWVWRETPDVATNHDMCYARSADGGKTWANSKGEEYLLPITAQTAELISSIPQNSELINQTSMVADFTGHPYIATYYRKEGSQVPQYHIIYLDENNQWQDVSLDFRETPFSLSGQGTKKIPIARPQILCLNLGNQKQIMLIYRDEERGSKVSIATCTDLSANQWIIEDLTEYSVGEWEPTYDTELWKARQLLHLFVQKVEQGDGEQNSALEEQPISVIEIPFKGNQIAITGESNSQSGYARISIFNKKMGVILSSLVDFYSKTPNKAVRFQTLRLPEGEYSLKIEVTGISPVWTDKANTRFGSTDCYVTIDNIVVL